MASSERNLVVALGFLVGLTPLIFYRGVIDAFDLTKATFVWMLLPALLLLAVGGLFEKMTNYSSLEWSFLTVSFTAIFAGLIVSFTSVNWKQSFFGYYQRHTGFLTFFASVLVAVSVCLLIGSRGRTALTRIMQFSAGISSLYVILQALEFDPFSWNAPGQNVLLFGTMGNINTSAGFLGVALPFAASSLFRDSRSSSQIGVVITGLVSAAIGLSQSFQGVVAGAFALVVIWMVERDFSLKGFLERMVVSGWLAFNLVVVKEGSDLTVSVFLAVLVSILLWISPLGVRGKRRARKTILVGFALAVVLVGGVFSFNSLKKEFDDGMRERRIFYASAVRSIGESPLVGRGFDSFVFHFGEGRSEGHAVDFESNRTSSPHSIPLGVFHSGGLLLGLPYLGLLSFGLVGSVRLLLLRGKSSVQAVAISAAFLGSLVQNLVSVEHVALLVVSGAVLGLCVGEFFEMKNATGSQVIGRSRKGSRRFRYRARMTLITALITAVVMTPWTTRPFRADSHALEGFKAVNRNDAPSGLQEFIEAFELVPWDAQQLSRLASLQEATGQVNESAASYLLLMDLSRYSPLFGVQAAFAVANSGDFSKASKIGDRVLARDPLAPVLRSEIVDLNEQLAQQMEDFGNLEAAESFREKADAILSAALK